MCHTLQYNCGCEAKFVTLDILLNKMSFWQLLVRKIGCLDNETVLEIKSISNQIIIFFIGNMHTCQ